jgi:hypothetical protein
MKKAILALAIVSVAFTACNNGGSEDTKKDSATVVTTDSTKGPVVTADTTKKDTVKLPVVDSSKLKK